MAGVCRGNAGNVVAGEVLAMYLQAQRASGYSVKTLELIEVLGFISQ